MEKELRLDKLLSDTGLWSRKEAKQLLKQGRVQVDGALAHRLLSPRYHVDKVYLAEIDGEIEEADTAAFEAGMILEDGTQCLPAGLEGLGSGLCRVTLREGKFHQVKRMLAQRGKPVRHLKRLSMGEVRLDEALKPGEFRPLTALELQNLKK